MSKSLIVMKFGGTSLATTEQFVEASRRIEERVREGYRPIVVVSAMGKETERLLALARELQVSGAHLEIDSILATGEQVSAGLMALALEGQGLQARSFSAHQVPLRTDGRAGDAQITHVETRALKAALADGTIPVVAGFQGLSPSNRLVTLGRGGSDTTAVALAAALGARVCEFYKDVGGVFASDPRQDLRAPKLPSITYGLMRAMSEGGAKVLHSRAVAMAQRQGVLLHVRSAFTSDVGSWVGLGEANQNKPMGAVHA